MKANFTCVLFAITIVISMASAACQNSAPSVNRQQASAVATPEKVDPAAIEAELIKLERGWADAGKNHDVGAAVQILADDVVITYPDGTTGTKGDELRVIAAGSISSESMDLLDPKVTTIDANAAFITGRTIIKNGKYKDGNAKPIVISGEYRFTDVYAKRNGKWQVVASQATKIVNPTPSNSSSPKPSASASVSPAKSTP